jgi:hypothetical protein
MQARTLLCAAALVAGMTACGSGSSHRPTATASSRHCDHPFPASLLLAANESSVVRMTAGGPQGILPGTRGILPHDLAMSHDRCAVAIVTEEDDSEGPLVVGSDGSTRRQRGAVGEANGIAWSPDDRRLAVSYQSGQDSSVRVVDVATAAGREVARFRGDDAFAYHVAWLDKDTVLVMRVGSDDVSIDRIGADGHTQPFLTPEQLGVGGIGFDTFAVDAPRNRLLLKVYSGTLVKPQDRRLIWVDLQTRDISPAMDAPLGRLDAPFAAVFSPGGDAVAFTVGRGGSGRYGCTIVRGHKRSDLPGNRQCFSLAWG